MEPIYTTAMKLYCLDSYDYCALKVILVAQGCGADVTLERVSSAGAMTDLHSEAKSLLLETPQGMETTQADMLKYLTSLISDKTLSGKTEQDSALIQGMVDSCWSDFGEFPLSLLKWPERDVPHDLSFHNF